MGLEQDIQSAKGYIPDAPTPTGTSSNGLAPFLWFEDNDIDGDAQWWANAPVGSRFTYKPDESTIPVDYMKMAAAGADSDWWINVPAYRIKKLPVTLLTTGEHDTGWDLPAKAIVQDVFVDVATLEATGTTKTIDVGLLASESGGDADGFLDGVSTATPAATRRGVPTITTGSNEVYFASTTRGVLLSSLTAGTDNAGDVGTYFEKPHIANSVTARSVTYTLGSAHTELVANIYVVYLQIG